MFFIGWDCSGRCWAKEGGAGGDDKARVCAGGGSGRGGGVAGGLFVGAIIEVMGVVGGK